jgi:centrosomal CEP192-like protein
MRARGRSSFHLAALAAFSVHASCVNAADASYHIGNSLTWDMYVGGLQQIAANFGVSLTPGYHIRNAASLVYMQDNPGDVSLDSPAIWTAALPSQSWNYVTFEPYPDWTTPSTLQSDITAAQMFISLVPKNSNTAPVFFIYEAWPDQMAFGSNYQAYWNQAVPDNLDQRTVLARQYFDALFQRLTARYGDTAEIRAIPVGEVLARIDQMIASGQFQGAANITDFYRDAYHMGAAGRFIAAITTFATIYRRDPAGAPFIAGLPQQPTDNGVVLTPQIAAELESIVWDVVTSNGARTGVYPITLSAASLAFQTTHIGASDQPQAVVLSNVTSRPLAIDAISVSENFLESSTCGTSLPANAACTVTVTFAPGVAGALGGTLTIRSGDIPYTVHLSGSAPVQASLNASATAATVGQSLVLSWSASAGATCQAQGPTTGSPWSGRVASSGTMSLTEASAGSRSYSLQCSAIGVANASVSTAVVWSWPPVDVSLSATPTIIDVGRPTLISWSSSGATDCSASGGGQGDGWSGTKPMTGTQSVTESVTSTSLTFTLTCHSSLSGLSKSSSVAVVQNVPLKTGGGGAADLLSVVAGLLWCWRRARLRSRSRGQPTLGLPITSTSPSSVWSVLP